MVAILCLSCCVGLAVFAVRAGKDIDEQLVGDLDSDAPRWSPSDIPSHTRTMLGVPLPATATHVHYRHSAGGPDVIGALRGDMSEAEFRALMRATRLTPWTPTRTFTDDSTWLGFSTYPASPPPAWWTPTTTIDENVWVRQDGSLWRMARFDGHTMWFSTISH